MGAANATSINLTGGQIAFPATQAPSADVHTLDDYEEGTWTPALKFDGNSVEMTYSVQSASYTKIGNRVFINGIIILTAKGSSTGNATIVGLPFTPKNDDSAYTSSSMYLSGVTFANVFVGVIDKNMTYIILYEITEAGVTTVLTNADFANSAIMIFNTSYIVE